MIDFDKPMRVKGSKVCRTIVPIDAGDYRAYAVNNSVCLIDKYGHIYEGIYKSMDVENVPDHPRIRYQAQYGARAGDWWPYRENQGPETATAYLIETDHGPDATPRYTYQREEVSHG